MSAWLQCCWQSCRNIISGLSAWATRLEVIIVAEILIFDDDFDGHENGLQKLETRHRVNYARYKNNVNGMSATEQCPDTNKPCAEPP